MPAVRDAPGSATLRLLETGSGFAARPNADCDGGGGDRTDSICHRAMRRS